MPFMQDGDLRYHLREHGAAGVACEITDLHATVTAARRSASRHILAEKVRHERNQMPTSQQRRVLRGAVWNRPSQTALFYALARLALAAASLPVVAVPARSPSSRRQE